MLVGCAEDVTGHGATQPLHVDAAVLEELVVLRRQKGPDHHGRDLVVGGEDAPLLTELRDECAVPGVDPGGGRRPVLRQFGRVRQTAEQQSGVDGEAQAADGDHAQHHHPRDRGEAPLGVHQEGDFKRSRPRERPGPLVRAAVESLIKGARPRASRVFKAARAAQPLRVCYRQPWPLSISWTCPPT